MCATTPASADGVAACVLKFSFLQMVPQFVHLGVPVIPFSSGWCVIGSSISMEVLIKKIEALLALNDEIIARVESTEEATYSEYILNYRSDLSTEITTIDRTRKGSCGLCVRLIEHKFVNRFINLLFKIIL